MTDSESPEVVGLRRRGLIFGAVTGAGAVALGTGRRPTAAAGEPDRQRVHGGDGVVRVTGAWTTWTTKALTVSLNTGGNTVRLDPTTADGLPNIDYLERAAS